MLELSLCYTVLYHYNSAQWYGMCTNEMDCTELVLLFLALNSFEVKNVQDCECLHFIVGSSSTACDQH